MERCVIISILVFLFISLQSAAQQADPREKCRELPDKELEPLKLKVVCDIKILGEKKYSEKLKECEPAEEIFLVEEIFCRSFFL